MAFLYDVYRGSDVVLMLEILGSTLPDDVDQSN